MKRDERGEVNGLREGVYIRELFWGWGRMWTVGLRVVIDG